MLIDAIRKLEDAASELLYSSELMVSRHRALNSAASDAAEARRKLGELEADISRERERRERAAREIDSLISEIEGPRNGDA
jgi:chromosome segregation ATPase